MRRFMLNLNSRYQRPVIQLSSWHNFEALLDTGAFFPVWTANERILNVLGGKCVKNNLVFPSIHIIACKDLEDVPFQLILSATMFSGLIYEIDDKKHKLNVTIPNDESMVRNLAIKDSKGKLHIMYESIF